VYKRQAVHEDGYIVAVLVVAFVGFILVHDLHEVAGDTVLIDKLDVALCAVIAFQELHVLPLDDLGLLDYAIAFMGELRLEETLPFLVGELDAVQTFELMPEIGNEIGFFVDREIFIACEVRILMRCFSSASSDS
jgi:hypothetical protein